MNSLPGNESELRTAHADAEYDLMYQIVHAGGASPIRCQRRCTGRRSTWKNFRAGAQTGTTDRHSRSRHCFREIKRFRETMSTDRRQNIARSTGTALPGGRERFDTHHVAFADAGTMFVQQDEAVGTAHRGKNA